MYYIPAGIMARSNPVFSELAGLSQEMLDKLTWSGFFINNLIPVTLGNIVGGGLFVGMAYWYSYKKA
jgi:formate/nitrite transporter FocA (FNT family)